MSDYALVPVVAPRRPAQAQLELRLWSPPTYKMPAATVEQLRETEGRVSDTRK